MLVQSRVVEPKQDEDGVQRAAPAVRGIPGAGGLARGQEPKPSEEGIPAERDGG